MYLDLEDLLARPPVGSRWPAEIAEHEAMHAVFAHMWAIPVQWITIIEAGRADGQVVAEFERTVFHGPRGDAHLERLEAIDFFVAGPLGQAAFRTRCSRDPVTVDALLWHFADTACGQDDLRRALAIARTHTGSRAQAARLVLERVGQTAHRIVERPQIRYGAQELGRLLVDFEELDGCDARWALDGALDGFSADDLAPRLERRLRGAVWRSRGASTGRHRPEMSRRLAHRR